jgi:hypothetical protein
VVILIVTQSEAVPLWLASLLAIWIKRKVLPYFNLRHIFIAMASNKPSFKKKGITMKHKLIMIALAITANIFANDIKSIAPIYIGDWYWTSSCGGITGGCRYPGPGDSIHLVVQVDSTDSGTITNPALVFKFYNNDTILKYGIADSTNISKDSFIVHISGTGTIDSQIKVPFINLPIHEFSNIHSYDVKAFGNSLSLGQSGSDNSIEKYSRTSLVVQSNVGIRPVYKKQNINKCNYLLNGKKTKEKINYKRVHIRNTPINQLMN